VPRNAINCCASEEQPAQHVDMMPLLAAGTYIGTCVHGYSLQFLPTHLQRVSKLLSAGNWWNHRLSGRAKKKGKK